MLIDGEKFACEACVRGHRVSNCQHADRPLQHINKKGRPVSQCQHCRAMRKHRASHHKCDCGRKSSRCIHMKSLLDGHNASCCCNHGGHCSCASKQDQPQLDTVPEYDSDEVAAKPKPKTGSRRRRANTIHSDGTASFDQRGHKSGHKSRESGPFLPSRSSSSREPRRARSAAASPLIGSPTFQQLNSQLPQLDLSGIEYPAYTNGTFDLFGSKGSMDIDAPMFSAGLSTTPVDWSHYDLPSSKGGDFAPSSYSQAGTQSFNGLFDFTSETAPTLAGTTSTSGEVSEVDDNFIPGDVDIDSINAGNSDYMRQRRMMARAGIGGNECEGYLKSSANKFLPTSGAFDDGGPIVGGTFSLEDDPAFWAQKYNTVSDSSDMSELAAAFWEN